MTEIFLHLPSCTHSPVGVCRQLCLGCPHCIPDGTTDGTAHCTLVARCIHRTAYLMCLLPWHKSGYCLHSVKFCRHSSTTAIILKTELSKVWFRNPSRVRYGEFNLLLCTVKGKLWMIGGWVYSQITGFQDWFNPSHFFYQR